jgi:hypothetical protein
MHAQYLPCTQHKIQSWLHGQICQLTFQLEYINVNMIAPNVIFGQGGARYQFKHTKCKLTTHRHMGGAEIGEKGGGGGKKFARLFCLLPDLSKKISMLNLQNCWQCKSWKTQCLHVVVISTREGNYPGDCNEITYGQLLVEVCKFANVLKAKGGYWLSDILIYHWVIPENIHAFPTEEIGS